MDCAEFANGMYPMYVLPVPEYLPPVNELLRIPLTYILRLAVPSYLYGEHWSVNGSHRMLHTSK